MWSGRAAASRQTSLAAEQLRVLQRQQQAVDRVYTEASDRFCMVTGIPPRNVNGFVKSGLACVATRIRLK